MVVVVSWESLRLLALLPKASISSMNMMQPSSYIRASLKSSLTLLGPTPTYSYLNSEAAILINWQPASAARARANMVFPVPGGP